MEAEPVVGLAIDITKDWRVDERFEDGRTRLMRAAYEGLVDVCTKLMGLGADPNLCLDGNGGWTALIFAASACHVEVCARLVQLGADVNIADSSGKTAVLIAAIRGHLDVCMQLVELGASPNSAGASGWTPLIVAAKKGNLPVCVRLIQLGANPNWVDRTGHTPLMWAFLGGHREVCAALLELGADPNLGDDDFETSLHVACREKKLELAKWLAEHMSTDASVGLNLAGMSALEVWGIPRGQRYQHAGDAAVEDEDKEEFRAHMDVLLTDTK